MCESKTTPPSPSAGKADTRFEREVRRWVRELNRIKNSQSDTHSPRDRLLDAVTERLTDIPTTRSTIRLPRRGGDLFVSASADSPAARGLQADLNAAANIGLRALTDPDWMGAWWFVLVNRETGEPVLDKVRGCPFWSSGLPLWTPATMEDKEALVKESGRKGARRAKRQKSDVYAWSLGYAPASPGDGWLATQAYWEGIERQVTERLRREQTASENPF